VGDHKEIAVGAVLTRKNGILIGLALLYATVFLPLLVRDPTNLVVLAAAVACSAALAAFALWRR
jgi:hypothetical protein